MFTGIIEALGEVTARETEGTNARLGVTSRLGKELKIDQSVSHNGVCLTVVDIAGQTHWVTAIGETLMKSNLGALSIGDQVNLERCMLNNGRFDGHIVQGHVDQVGTIKNIRDENGSWVMRIEYDPASGNVTVEKGSIAVNEVSLTCFDSGRDAFSVAIIPYTYEHTNFRTLKAGDPVNLEFDIIGKYVKRLLATR